MGKRGKGKKLKGKPTYGGFPISKPVGVMLRITAHHRDKCVHYQSYHEEDLEDGHIKLRSSEPANRESVENT
jgi:hypothetical protein